MLCTTSTLSDQLDSSFTPRLMGIQEETLSEIKPSDDHPAAYEELIGAELAPGISMPSHLEYV